MALQNGLYKVSFRTPLGEGNGVIVLQDGQVRGGDSIIYYIGTYTQDGNQFSADVTTDAHSNTLGLQPVFGKPHVRLNVKGTTQEDSVTLTATSPDAPGVTAQGTLTRLGD